VERNIKIKFVKCPECGKGAVERKTFHNYLARLNKISFVVKNAVIDVCDTCGAKFYNSKEIERWERIRDKRVRK